MLHANYEQIIEKIQKEKGLTPAEIEARIRNKLKELSDLISKEGAAYIIANELGVKVYEDISRKSLKINQLIPGMNSVNIVGKVMQIYSVREFDTGTRQGKIGSLLIGDETGTIRVVIWDTNHIREIENDNVRLDKVIKIKNAYVKDNNGFREVHMGNRALLELNPEETITEVRTASFNKKQIKDLIPGENATISGTIVQVFEPRFYDACSQCNKKVDINNGASKCEVHQNADVVKQPVLNLYLDDGTDSIRVVAFRNLAEGIINNINNIRENPAVFEELKNDVLGEQFKFTGKVTKNDMFDRKEFIINNIDELKPEDIVNEVEEIKF